MSVVKQFWEMHDSKKKKTTLTQLQRYILQDSPKEILRFIEIGGGPAMGTRLEEFARFKFSSLKKRESGKNTGYDQLLVVDGKNVYIEQKASGHWKTDDFRWQHVEPDHKWTMLLLCGIGYTEVKFWAISRKTFDKLVSQNKITNQGNKEKNSTEGMWFWYSDVKDDLTLIETNESLIEFSRLQVLNE